MKDKGFIDTNVFIYVFLEDEENVEKRRVSSELLQKLSSADVVISTQVLSEIYSVMLRNKISDKVIQEKEEILIAETLVSPITLETIKKSWEIRTKYAYSYWDSLIIASALENNCLTLYTEDMHDGQVIEDRLRIINPFEKKVSKKRTGK